ncbi:MAG: hypothetical protein WC443_01075 [Desulfobaccales bacterium]
MKRFILLLVIVVLAAGCSSFAASKYSIGVDNYSALRRLAGTSLNVGPFTATKPGQSEISCRAAGPIKTPDGEPFAEFVRQALVDELEFAHLFSATGPVTLTGNLDRIDFSSTSGVWHLGLTVTSSNSRSLTVTADYAYATSFSGQQACRQTAQALMPAVQHLIGKLVGAPEFPGLATP